MAEEKKEEVKVEHPFGYYIVENPTEFQRLIVKEGKQVDFFELLIDVANKVERAGLK